MRAQRYHTLRSGYNLTSVLNNPFALAAHSGDETDSGAIYVGDAPGLSDEEIGVAALRVYLKQMALVVDNFEGAGPNAQLSLSAAMLTPHPPRRSASGYSSASSTAGHHHHQPNHQPHQPHHQPSSHLTAQTQSARWAALRLREAEEEAERHLVECFAGVPEIYFREDFEQKFPTLFAEISERADSMLQQEKLSHYLDLVEVLFFFYRSSPLHSPPLRFALLFWLPLFCFAFPFFHSTFF